jgi:hypothetical protein
MAGGKVVTCEYLSSLLGKTSAIKGIVRALILEQLHSLEVAGRDLVVEDVIVEYVVKTLKRDRELLRSSGSDGFEILGLEKKFEREIDGFRFVGYVDRMDSLRPGEIRIIDYKTGRVEDKDVNISDENAEAVVDALFGPVNEGRPKIALQLYLYDVFCRESGLFNGQRMVNVIYPPANLFTEQVKEVPVSETFMNLTEERLHGLLPAKHIVEIELQGDLRPSLVHGTEQGIDNRLRVLVADVDILVLHPARLVVDDADLSRAQAVHPVHVPDETKPVDLPLELFLQPKDLEAVRSG